MRSRANFPERALLTIKESGELSKDGGFSVVANCTDTFYGKINRNRAKVLILKLGPNGCCAGLNRAHKAFRDADFDIINSEVLSPSNIAAMAVQEEADVVGVSISTAHCTQQLQSIICELEKRGKGDVLVLPEVLSSTQGECGGSRFWILIL